MRQIDTPICPFCGLTERIEVAEHEYIAYVMNRILIQEAFPNMTPAQRERFISGVCGPCWDKNIRADAQDQQGVPDDQFDPRI